MKRVVSPIQGWGTAMPEDVLTGTTFTAGASTGQPGTMPNQGSPTFTPGNSSISLPAGYYEAGSIATPFTVITSSQTLPAGSYLMFIQGAGGGSTASYYGGTGAMVMVDTGPAAANSNGYTVTIGAGGTAGSSSTDAGNGGDTTVTWVDSAGTTEKATAAGGTGATTTANGAGGTASFTGYNYISLLANGNSNNEQAPLSSVIFTDLNMGTAGAASSAGNGGGVAYWRYA